MPPINHAAMSAGVIAVSVVAAAAIAVYESPELQRMAQDLRRRIAIALHQFGDSISPQERENLFNRPEDAEGFLRSRGLGPGAEPGIDADDETRRRQREELMYWNAQREQRQRPSSSSSATLKSESSPVATPRSPGTSFDDFLKRDARGEEKGSFVYHSGSQIQEGGSEAHLRRRGDAASTTHRGLDVSRYTNPFSDEHGFDDDMMRPEKDEMSDIYSATDVGGDDNALSETRPAAPPVPPKSPLVDIAASVPTSQTPTLLERDESFSGPHSTERELGPDEFMTAGQAHHHEQQNDAYSSIQAWAQGTASSASSHPANGFYSPLPETPAAPMSEAELISEGQLTPTDSASLAGWSVAAASAVDPPPAASVSAMSHASRDEFDVVSEDGSGMMTPASWSEVGSVVSSNDNEAVPAAARLA